MKKVILFSIFIFSIAFANFIVASTADQPNLEDGAKVFKATCAQCHAGGKNIVNRAKTLSKPDLEKYGMYSLEAIVTQVTKGKSAMPAFKGRHTPQQIENVAAYVLYQAEKGWKK